MRTIERDIVGGFIFSGDGKILLGRSYKGGVFPDCWVVPGGGVEPGESKKDAFIREILEETGIDVSREKIEEIMTGQHGESDKTLRKTGETVHVKMHFFDFKVTLSKPATDISIHAVDDFLEGRWFSAEEAQSLKLSPSSAFALRKIGYLKD